MLSNDTDPEANYPLSLLSVAYVSGTASAYISGGLVRVEATEKGSSVYTYVVADSLGATATGTLNITSTGTLAACSDTGTNATSDGDSTDATTDNNSTSAVPDGDGGTGNDSGEGL